MRSIICRGGWRRMTFAMFVVVIATTGGMLAAPKVVQPGVPFHGAELDAKAQASFGGGLSRDNF
jgi:hypothetical protein